MDINSGIKMYVTKKYREIEAGIFVVATLPDPLGIIIPPKASALSLEYMCRNNLLKNIFGPSGEITIFANIPHTHSVGIQVFSKIVRNGTEIDYIANNKYFSSDYQYLNVLAKPVTLKRVKLFSIMLLLKESYSLLEF